MNPFTLFLFILFLFSNQLLADPIILNDSIHSVYITDSMVQIHEDKNGALTFDQLQQIDSASFSNYTYYYNRHVEDAYWIKFIVDPSFTDNRKWIIEIQDSRFSEVDVYYPNTTGQYIKKSAGLLYPIEAREYGHKNFVMDMDFVPGNKSVCYVRYKSALIGNFIFKIRANDEFSTYAFHEYLLLGLYYGMLLIIVLYNIILFVTLKEKIYIFYLLYVLTWIFDSLLSDSLGFQFIWSDWPWMSVIGYYISKPLLVIFFVFYAAQFLHISDYSAKLSKWNIYIGIGTAFSLLLSSYLSNSTGLNIFGKLVWILFSVPFIYLYYISIKLFLKGYTSSRFFIAGTSVLIITLLLRISELIPGVTYFSQYALWGIILFYGVNIALVVEIITFTIALGDRIRYLKEKEEKAQNEIIYQLKINESLHETVTRELEEKVTDRTSALRLKSEELQQANLKLELQALEINKWNQILDLDNHTLKTKVKEVNEARIKSTDVPYLEFLTIFPNDLTCERYLEEIKWKDGYKCKKCGNEKYGNGNKQFSRRCSTCRYDESVTAYTIFHKCKFPLVKAFYIITKVNKYGDDLNSYEIARELELRKGTVWEFKKKVLEAKQGEKGISDNPLDAVILSYLK